MLSDLRESGSIEQDADIVSFIYRPEYYKITEDESGRDLRGVAEIIIAKHRNGETNTAKLKWTGNLAKFDNLDHSDFDIRTMPSKLNSPSNEPPGIEIAPMDPDDDDMF